MLNEGTLAETIIEQSDATPSNKVTTAAVYVNVSEWFTRPTVIAHMLAEQSKARACEATDGKPRFTEFRLLGERVRGLPVKRFWLSSGDTDEQVEQLASKFERLSAEGYAVYYGANPRIAKRGDHTAVIDYVTNAVDIDFEKAGFTLQYVIGEVDKSGVEFDKLNFTGHGLQGTINHLGTDDISEYTDINGVLQRRFKHLGADQSIVTDTARILRVPGTPNLKYGQVVPTDVLFEDVDGKTRPFNVVVNHLKSLEPSSSSFTTVNEPKKANSNFIAVAEPLYELSPFGKWLRSGRVIYQGNPTGEKHVEGLSGRNDTAWKLASRCAEPDKPTGMPYSEALYVYGLVVEHQMFPSLGDADDDTETWEEMLTRAYKQYRGADRSTWEYRGRASEREDQEQELVSDDNCSDGILLADFLGQRGSKRDELLYGLERFMPAVLFGPSGVGKTTVTLEVLFHAIAGIDFHGWTACRVRILMIVNADSDEA